MQVAGGARQSSWGSAAEGGGAGRKDEGLPAATGARSQTRSKHISCSLNWNSKSIRLRRRRRLLYSASSSRPGPVFPSAVSCTEKSFHSRLNCHERRARKFGIVSLKNPNQNLLAEDTTSRVSEELRTSIDPHFPKIS